MIIVNQNKDAIINFDNLTQIYITQDEEETIYLIRCETVGCLYETLGTYKTEERAKEILKQIIKAYREYRTAECDGYTNVLKETAVFEIPKE